MSRSCRPCTPPLALATLNAATMPRCIFWPSSLVGPLIAAEIPNRISLAVTPRTVLRGSCGFGESDACCAGALADGPAPEVAAIVVAGASALFAGALFAESRSDGLEACDLCESALSSASAPCHSGFAKMIAIATRAANEATTKVRLISVIDLSSHRRDGSEMRSGHEANSDLVCRSGSTSVDEETVGVELT